MTIRIGDLTGRTTEEWIGKTPDTAIPARVKLRIFEAHGGRCYLSGRKINPGDAYDFDHKLALCNGGENRESNLAPVLRVEHRKKTADDVNIRAKADRVRKKHLGIWKPKTIVPGSKASPWKKRADGTVVRRDQEQTP